MNLKDEVYPTPQFNIVVNDLTKVVQQANAQQRKMSTSLNPEKLKQLFINSQKPEISCSVMTPSQIVKSVVPKSTKSQIETDESRGDLK